MFRNRFHHRMPLAISILLYVVFPAAWVLLLTSCATTKVTGVWKDENYRGTIRKVVVVGVFENQDTRKIFEDEFADQLKARGVEAFASHKIFPGEKLPGKDIVVEKLRNIGADGLLVTRIIDTETVKIYASGTSYVVPSYYSYYGTYYNYVYSPGHTYNEGFAYAETNYYEVKEEKLVWSGRSKTEFETRRYELIQAFVKIMIEKMAEDKLVR